MKNTLSVLTSIAFLFLCACNRDDTGFRKQQDGPILKRTVTKNAAGTTTSVINYNNKGFPISDTLYDFTGEISAYILFEYNSKLRLTRITNVVPLINSTELYEEEYVDDTIPVVSRHSLKGNLVTLTKHFYNTSRKLILDSIYHLGFPVSSDTRTYSYDPQGRLLTNTALNNLNDSSWHLSYQYSTNHREEFKTSFSYNPLIKSYSKTVTDSTATGNILSEKVYSPLNQLSSQKDYTYDATGHLLKITTVITGSYRSEVLYFNNLTSGKPEKYEVYLDNKLVATTTYYYE